MLGIENVQVLKRVSNVPSHLAIPSDSIWVVRHQVPFDSVEWLPPKHLGKEGMQPCKHSMRPLSACAFVDLFRRMFQSTTSFSNNGQSAAPMHEQIHNVIPENAGTQCRQ